MEYRYIQIEEDGRVKATCSVSIEGVTIDTEGMTVPEMPTDAVYDLHYNETDGLHWVKVADLETPEQTTDPVMEKLDSIEAKIQTNEDLQTFYDDIVKEVGL